MASSVFYKFKSSKEPSRIAFDGTGISVFELKREIIAISGLGDGSDFDLFLYPEDQPTTEYDDDTTIISRSSTVIAVRRPAVKGHGRAARYVSGRAPVRARKAEPARAAVSNTAPGVALTEEDAEAAFLRESGQVWAQQKEELSHAKPVFHNKKKPVNVPTHDPPPGYVCYRCQKKGHWIQACPTNNDPDFQPAPRAKRTTGIPKSFLQSVEKPVDGELDRGVMLNADGEYVMVRPDTKAWEKFQEKANASKAQAANADAASKEIRERGLECSIDNRMFVDPVKTPCCGKTYCHDCIENALADGDLVCPNCAKDGVLIDDLVTDDDMVEKIRAYEAEKAKEKLDKEQRAKEEAKAAAKPSSPSNNEHVSVPTSDEKAKASEMNRTGSKSPKPSSSTISASSDVKSPLTVAAAKTDSTSTPGAGGNGSDTDTSSTSKKRKADIDVMPPSAPKAMRLQKEQEARQAQNTTSAIEKNFFESMEALKNMPNVPNVPMPNVTTGMSMGMPMNPMMGMMNPPNMNGMNGMNGYNNMNNWNGYNGYPNMYNNMGYSGMNGMNSMNGVNMGYGAMNQMNGNIPNGNMNPMNGNMGYGSWNQNQNQYAGNMGYQNQSMPASSAAFPNQQRTIFSEQPSEKDAYERKPLNPQRSQNRQRRQRPTDYHYVGQT